MGSAIEVTTHRNPHPVDYIDYFKMVEALNGTAHAKTAFWPLEASIILYARQTKPNRCRAERETVKERERRDEKGTANGTMFSG
jgi:hypothetical protein